VFIFLGYENIVEEQKVKFTLHIFHSLYVLVSSIGNSTDGSGG
jgi:hypothetical protein